MNPRKNKSLFLIPLFLLALLPLLLLSIAASINSPSFTFFNHFIESGGSVTGTNATLSVTNEAGAGGTFGFRSASNGVTIAATGVMSAVATNTAFPVTVIGQFTNPAGQTLLIRNGLIVGGTGIQ